MRLELAGQGASRGSALGRARLRIPHALEVAQTHVEDVETEIARLHAAIDSVRTDMHELRARLHGALAQDVGEFIELHALLLDDPELLASLDTLIRTGRYAADYALRLQRDRIAAVFTTMEDDYLRTRIDDIDQVIGRIHAALHRHAAQLKGVAGDILVADDVTPAELAQLQSQGVLAIITAGGSLHSHSAILARSLHLPLVVGAAEALSKINDGDVLALDGDSGRIIRDPNDADLRAHRARQQARARERQQLYRLRREPSCTRDGTDIKLYANAESLQDVAEAHALGAAGIGLYRTEFLFLRHGRPADEEEQFQAYRDAVLGMTGRMVTIRTADIGADKADQPGPASRREPNPAIGLRGIRLSLAHPAWFRIQLRAIVRASGYGPLQILLPMVSAREELIAARALLQEVIAELHTAGCALTKPIRLGAMIEVPAAALMLGGWIDLLDFVSVGTNDLAQYLLAADRDNEALSALYDPRHPALIRLLRQVIHVAHARRRPVMVCGEMAGDPTCAPLLLALGLEQFSLHPSTLLEVRRAIRAQHLHDLRAHRPALLRARERAHVDHWLDAARRRAQAKSLADASRR